MKGSLEEETNESVQSEDKNNRKPEDAISSAAVLPYVAVFKYLGRTL